MPTKPLSTNVALVTARRKRRIFDRREMVFLTHVMEGVDEDRQVKHIRRLFSAVRCYHQCRPIDPSAYYVEGFKLPNVNAIIQEAHRIYEKHVGRCPYETVVAAAEKTLRVEDPDPICLSFEYEFGLAYASHYLVSGSEFLGCILGRLPPSAKVPSPEFLLRDFGIPTLFELTLPMAFVPDEVCNQIARMLREYAEEPDNYKVPEAADEGFGIEKPIPGKYITNHWHPPRIFDQFHPTESHDGVYENHHTSCVRCEDGSQ